jgi:hypothetical protein
LTPEMANQKRRATDWRRTPLHSAFEQFWALADGR